LKKRCTKLFLISRKLLAFLGATIAVPALYAQQPPPPDPAQQPYPLLNPVYQTNHGRLIPSHTEYVGPNAGKVVPDACVFHVHLAAGEKAVEARQISAATINSGTDCQADFVVGVPTQIAPPSTGPIRTVSAGASSAGPGFGVPPPPGAVGGAGAAEDAQAADARAQAAGAAAVKSPGLRGAGGT
jgi:hypothetical protein